MVETQVDELRARAAREADSRIAINAALLAEAPEPLASRLVHTACKKLLPTGKRIESQHVLEMVRRAADPAFSLDAPGGISAWHESGELIIGRREETAWLEPARLDVPGEVLLPDGRILCAELMDGTLELLPSDASALVDADALDGELTVSGPVAGERMCPLGMDGSHKLVSDILSEAKVPRRLRAGVPVVRCGDRVVWVAGIRLDDRFRITPETVCSLRLILR